MTSRTPRYTGDTRDASGALLTGQPAPGTLGAYGHLPRKAEKKPGELNAWGGKIRPIAESITNSEGQFRDPPREISRLMGHKPYFDSIGAVYIHRVGLFQGIGWVLPHSGAKDDINYAKVTLNPDGRTYDMYLGRVQHDSNWQPDTIEVLRVVTQIPGPILRETYEKETVDQ